MMKTEKKSALKSEVFVLKHESSIFRSFILLRVWF